MLRISWEGHVRAESLSLLTTAKSRTSHTPALPFPLSIPVTLSHSFSCIKLMCFRVFTELIQFINPRANNSLFCHISFPPGQQFNLDSPGVWYMLDLLLAWVSKHPGTGRRSNKMRMRHCTSPAWSAVKCHLTFSNLTPNEEGFFAGKKWNYQQQLSSLSSQKYATHSYSRSVSILTTNR